MKRAILVLIFCSLLLASQPAFAKDPALVNTGFSQIKRGYIQKAIPTFQKATKLYPTNAKAHLGLAIAYQKQGDEQNTAKAIQAYRQVLELDSNNYTATKNLAQLLSWKPSTRYESLELFANARKMQPNDKEMLYNYAEALTWEGRTFEATDIFRGLLKDNPKSIDLNVKLANALSSSGKYEESLQYYQKALAAKYTFDTFSALKYAQALANTNNLCEAESIYQNLLKNERDAEALVNIQKEYSSALYNNNKYLEAIQIDQSIEPKDKYTLLRLANSYQKAGNQQEALRLFEQLYSQYPNDTEIKRSAAGFLSSVGGYDITAMKMYTELVQTGFATTEDKINLAVLMAKNPETKQEAINGMRAMLNSGDLTSFQEEKVKTELARTLASVENTRPEAAILYRELLSRDPGNLDLQIDFVELLSWQDSTRREALLSYMQLMEKYPLNQRIKKGFNDTLGWYKPVPSDMELYNAILAKEPGNIAAIKGKAFILSQNPNTVKEARRMYDLVLEAEPNNPKLKMQVADMLARNDKTRKDALDLYEELQETQGNSIELQEKIASNYLYTKNYRKANKAFEAILDQDPDNKEALLGKARLNAWQGYNLGAYQAYKKLYKLYPGDEVIAYEYATIAQKVGRKDTALEILSKIKEQSFLPDAPELPTIAYAYQVLSTGNSANPADELRKIQADLEKLERELQQLQLSNQASAKSLNDLTTQVNNADRNTHYAVSDLPDPSAPAQVALDNAEQPAILTDEDVYTGPDYDFFKRTSTQNFLSGKRYRDMMSNFGTLEEDLEYSLRPETIRGVTIFNEKGNPTSDGLEYFGVPSMYSFSLTPQTRIRAAFETRRYQQTAAIAPSSITNAIYTLGLNTRPHERVTFDGEVTLNTYSGPDTPVDVMGKGAITLKMHDKAKMRVGFTREPLYQSVFSDAGYAPRAQFSRSEFVQLLSTMATAAPAPYTRNTSAELARYTDGAGNPTFAGDPEQIESLLAPFSGQARDNAIGVEFNFIPYPKWDFNVGYEYSAITGDNIPSNSRNQVFTSFGRTFTGIPNHLVRLGYQFLYFGYGKEASAFPGMVPFPYRDANGDLLTVTRQPTAQEALAIVNQQIETPGSLLGRLNPVTGAVIDPTPNLFMSPLDVVRAPRGAVLGGYFSPTQFYQNSIRLDIEGKLFDGKISYKAGGSLGVQNFGDRIDRDDILASRGLLAYKDIPANDPRRTGGAAENVAFNNLANLADSIIDNTDPTSLASAFDVTVFINPTKWLSIYNGVDYLNSGGQFDRWRYNGGIILRPDIKFLSPLIGKNPAEEEDEDVEAESDVQEGNEINLNDDAY